jgi:hypothetical protein
LVVKIGRGDGSGCGADFVRGPSDAAAAAALER